MNWEEFQIEKEFYRKAWELLKADFGIVSVSQLNMADLNGSRIVEDLIKKEILEKVSSGVYLKINEVNAISRPQEIAESNFDEIWSILERINPTQEGLCKFLIKSYLVVSCKWHFGIDDDLITVGKDCPQFFVYKGRTVKFLEIVNQIKALEGLKSDNKAQLENFIDQANSIDKRSIFVVDDWRIGPVFTTVDMDFIQTIKKSPYCDQDKTKMRAYSIDVVLKKVNKGGDK